MKSTLILLSISVIMIQGNSIWILVEQTGIPLILDGLLTGFPQQTVEKTAMLIDIARLWILVIAIGGTQNSKK